MQEVGLEEVWESKGVVGLGAGSRLLVCQWERKLEGMRVQATEQVLEGLSV